MIFSIRHLLCAICLITLLVSPRIQPLCAAPPNILIFLVDDLGYGDLGYSGSELAETPRIDRFAEENLVFTSGYAPSPQCSPTRASILTGQYPARLHITVWIGGSKDSTYQNLRLPQQKRFLGEEVFTMGEYFQSRGYETVQIGKWHCGSSQVHPSRHGFDRVIGLTDGAGPGPGTRGWYGPYPQIPDLEGPEDEYITDRLTDEAIRYMEGSSGKPFFMMLQHFDVHAPLTAPEENVQKYLDRGRPLDKGPENATFLAMKDRTDDSFGRILDALDRLALDGNTIVIFFSDNGGVSYFANNGPLKGGKKYFTEGGIRVPMILKVPGMTGPGVSDVPVNGIDFFPTLVELTGGSLSDVPSTLDGVSLVPLLEGKSLERESLFWHHPQASKDYSVIPPQGVVRQGPWKLIHYYGDTQPHELYHLDEDISEKINLAGQHPDRVENMTRDLMQHLEDTKAQQVEVMAP